MEGSISSVYILIQNRANPETWTEVYRIYLAIRWGFPLSRITTNKSVLQNFALIQVLSILNNPKDLDPSYKIYKILGIVLEGK